VTERETVKDTVVSKTIQDSHVEADYEYTSSAINRQMLSQSRTQLYRPPRL